MYSKVIIVSLLVLSLFGGCKKNSLPPEETSEEPVFYVKATIGSENVDYKAGQDGYYMNAAHSQNADNVYVYEGDLSQKTCTGTCGWNFDIQINDYTVSAVGATMNPNEGLKPANSFQYNDGNLEPLGFNGAFLAGYIPSICQYTWTYSDGAVITHTYPDVSDTHYFKRGTQATVSLTTYDFNKTSVLSNSYNIGNPLQASVLVDRTTPNDFSFNVQTTIPASNYYWDFGDGFTSQLTQTSPTITHQYSPTPGPATFVATCYITAPGGNSCTVKAFANTDNLFYHANFTSTLTPVPNSKKLCAITIRATSPDGKVYTSESIDQPSTSSFEILSVESYKENNSGDPTKKVTVRFNCVVKNGTETKTISNGEAVIAVSYK